MRHERQSKRKRIAERSIDADAEAIARDVTYVGSQEHKDHPSPAGSPRLRSDASRCDPRYQTFVEPTRALRAAILAQRMSSLQGRFPKYVWGKLDGQLYEARLVNHEMGQYKAYPIERDELPEDPDGRLEELD